jgi:ATP-dependent Clp protease protease subunit
LTVLIHQPLGGFQGQASILHPRQDILSLRERLTACWPSNTGKPIGQEKDTERDNF